MKKIAIIGSGGVGGYFGAKLAQAGYEVTFLARGAHLKAMRNNGLIVKSIDGDFIVKNINATDKIDDMAPVDLVLIGVKAWQVSEIAAELLPLLKENTMILPLQNGVLAAEELGSIIPKKHIIGGLCRIIAKIESPGVIAHLGIEPSIVFGELNSMKTGRLHVLKKLFDQAGIHSRISDNIQIDLWKKFMFICSGGLLAITRSTYGELRELPETNEMFRSIFEEIYQLAVKSGIALKPAIIQKTIDFIGTLPDASTASMARDVWEGKPSEIEYQNGAVVKLAEKLNIAVPVNRFIYQCILPMEKRARDMI